MPYTQRATIQAQPCCYQPPPPREGVHSKVGTEPGTKSSHEDIKEKAHTSNSSIPTGIERKALFLQVNKKEQISPLLLFHGI
jgi:hypothetical protein